MMAVACPIRARARAFSIYAGQVPFLVTASPVPPSTVIGPANLIKFLGANPLRVGLTFHTGFNNIFITTKEPPAAPTDGWLNNGETLFFDAFSPDGSIALESAWYIASLGVAP